MNREEILQKAQQENKGKDLAELEATKKGTYLAFTIGGLLTIAIVIINFIVTETFMYGAIAGVVSMVFVTFLIKYIKLRKKHELVCTIVYGLWFVFFFTFWILQLCKVMK